MISTRWHSQKRSPKPASTIYGSINSSRGPSSSPRRSEPAASTEHARAHRGTSPIRRVRGRSREDSARRRGASSAGTVVPRDKRARLSSPLSPREEEPLARASDASPENNTAPSRPPDEAHVASWNTRSQSRTEEDDTRQGGFPRRCCRRSRGKSLSESSRETHQSHSFRNKGGWRAARGRHFKIRRGQGARPRSFFRSGRRERRKNTPSSGEVLFRSRSVGSRRLIAAAPTRDSWPPRAFTHSSYATPGSQSLQPHPLRHRVVRTFKEAWAPGEKKKREEKYV